MTRVWGEALAHSFRVTWAAARPTENIDVASADSRATWESSRPSATTFRPSWVQTMMAVASGRLVWSSWTAG